MRWSALVLGSGLCVAGGCAVSHDVGGGGGAVGSGIALSAECQAEVDDAFDGLPKHFNCTGLYSDTENKELAPSREEFKPAHPLWSDASVKTRWLYLPEGTTIDASNPKNWVFPVGTRFWKEFRNPAGDKRIETRVFMKTSETSWSRAAYQWDDDEKNATLVDGKDIMVDGKPYRVPSRTQCDECHKGRRDRALGFDQASLGLPEAEGYTLSQLLAQDKLTNFKGPTYLQIGPEPESAEARALGWMHTNCGVSCHNDNSNSKAFSNGMRLMLDPEQLDGRSTSEFETVQTTVDQDVFALQWSGRKRIVPGQPDESWLLSLITQRGDPKEQMPPLASNEVDQEHVDYVRQWIEGLAQAQQSPTGE